MHNNRKAVKVIASGEKKLMARQMKGVSLHGTTMTMHWPLKKIKNCKIKSTIISENKIKI